MSTENTYKMVGDCALRKKKIPWRNLHARAFTYSNGIGARDSHHFGAGL